MYSTKSKHAVGHLQIMSEPVDRLAADALLQEVRATPKPGLVDRANSGAHSDMDYDTFVDSIISLKNYFGGCFKIGAQSSALPESDTLLRLQELGRTAEKEMLRATRGVNTHKGAIFSMGLICGAAGRLWFIEGLSESLVFNTVSVMCRGLCDRAFINLDEKPPDKLTKGERMYIKYGITGARGEAESGFSTVANIALPTYSRLMEQGVPTNNALVETLLHLIAYTEDTNIVSRHNRKTAAFARRAARDCIRLGGFIENGGAARLEALDREFIKRNISPGGSADLLAVTYFIYNLQRLYTLLYR